MIDESDWITKDKLLDILPTMDEEYHRVLFRLLFMTGGRISEVLSLRKKDITVKSYNTCEFGQVTLPNLKQRQRSFKTVLVDLDVDEDLFRPVLYFISNIGEDDLLFPSRKGEGHISRRWALYLAKKYFGMGTHCAGRHSFAMNAVDRNYTVFDLQEQGGWSKLSSMSKYIHKLGLSDRASRMIDRKRWG